jgi:hypothetical protein
MMDNLLEPESDVATTFVDDILIGTRAEDGEDLPEKHYADVCRVLELLKHYNWWGMELNVKCLCRMFHFVDMS